MQDTACSMQVGLEMASGGFGSDNVHVPMVNGLPVDLAKLGSNTARYLPSCTEPLISTISLSSKLKYR